MDIKKNEIKNRWVIIIISTIILLLLVLIFSILREVHQFNNNIDFYFNQILTEEKDKIKNEVENRVDEVYYHNETYLNDYLDKMNNELNYFIFLLESHQDEYQNLVGEDKINYAIDLLNDYANQYNDTTYFAFDTNGVVYYSSTIDTGTNVINIQDNESEDYIFLDMIDLALNSENNDGYYTYNWIKEKDSSEFYELTSYVYYDQDLDIIFGKSIYKVDYLEDIQQHIYDQFLSYYENVNSYIYIFSYDGIGLVHKDANLINSDITYIESLDGENFHESVMEIINTTGSGFYEYDYYEYGLPTDEYVPKITYVKGIDEWNVYIGQTLSVNDINEINNQFYQSRLDSLYINISIILLIMIIGGVVVGLLIRKNILKISRMFEEEQKKIEYISFHDYLTGFYNRRYFEENINKIIDKYFPFVLIMADVNGLKLVNDAFGHNIGDKLLTACSNTISSNLKDNDFAIRWGGDEFLIVLGKSSDKEAIKFINKIKGQCSKTKIETVDLSISLGYRVYRDKSRNIEQAITKAEEMMYSNKVIESPSMKSSTIKGIINTLHNNYSFEKKHSIGVSRYAELIALEMGLPDIEVKKLKLIGEIHDIGKIGLSQNLLNKVDKLNEDDWIKIRQHSEIGYRILSAYSELSEYAETVLYHHERWDGKGYPKGLKEEEIPLYARIICVADSYHAMTSDRIYKKALSKEEAVKELIACKGTQFDPNIVNNLLNVIKKGD